MNRPPFEVADIIRLYGNSFIARNASWLTWLHLRVLLVIYNPVTDTGYWMDMKHYLTERAAGGLAAASPTQDTR